MKISNLLTMSSVAALLGSVAATTAPVAMAQDQSADIEEVVVTGSRRAPRTALDSAAPVDVFSATDFQDQGTSDMNDLLRNLVPTFNVDVQDINDSNSLVRPATLRGLPADDTLVLVNGKRRHRSAAVQFGRREPTSLTSPRFLPLHCVRWKCCATAHQRNTALMPSQA